jgi:outer membrane lipoprotein-sorting protein
MRFGRVPRSFPVARLIILWAMVMSWGMVMAPGRVAGLDLTPDLLFQQMEEKTEKIFSLISEVELSSGSLRTHVTLSIQSPDKFAMDFEGNHLRVVFDGERLWIYIAALAEVFTLDTSGGGGWLSEALREWVNPREIVTRITRKTLFSFFDVTLLDRATVATLAATLGLPPDKVQVMRFQPIGRSVFQRVFDVGFYHLVFSLESYLPVMVQEFAPDGSSRGMLRVLQYRINDPIPKERFIFGVPPGVKEVPLSAVIAQKLEQSKEYLVERVGQMIESLRRKLTDWGL